MDKHAIPQNIMEVEFKLFGSLTIRQFVSLAGGITGAVIIYFIGLPIFVSWPLMLFSVILGMSMSFVTINGQSFGRWFTNFVLALFTSQRYIWRRTPRTPKSLKAKFKVQEDKGKRIRKKEFGSAPIAEIVAQRSIELDEDEKVALSRIDKYFSAEFKKYRGTEDQQSEAREVPKRVDQSKEGLAGKVNPIGRGQAQVRVGAAGKMVYPSMKNQKRRPFVSEDEIIEEKVKKILSKQKVLEPFIKTKEVEEEETDLKVEMKRLYKEIQEIKKRKPKEK